MSIEVVGIIFSILLGVFSIVITLVQIRIQIQQIRASTSAFISDKLDELYKSILEHPEVEDELNQPYKKKVRRLDRAEAVTEMRINLYEQVFLQYSKYSLIDKAEWGIWRKALEEILATPYVSGYWLHIRDFYDPRFIKEVDRIIQDKALLDTLISNEVSIVANS